MNQINAPSQTPSQLLATLMLGEPITDWIARRRDEGATWRILTRELRERTGGQLDLTEKTLRQWAGVA